MKARFLAITALILGMVSCQKDQAGLDVIVDGEQETTISVSLPEATRANSALGAVDNEVLKEYDLRYILEIYDEENCIKRMVNVEDESTSTAFDVRLIPGYTYTFVAWADFVTEGSVAYVDGVEQNIDLYYNTKTANGLKAVSVKGEWVAMTEARDAYTGKHRENSYSSASNITLKLKRPFAKLRVVTTDVEVLKNLGDVTTTNVSVDYRTKVYTGFNALTEEPNSAVDLGAFEYVPNVYTETNQTDLTLLADYLFGTENGTIQFDLTATFSNGKHTTTNFNTDIPLVRNKVTTIKGNILTDGSNIKVDVGDDFIQPGEEIEYVEVGTAADLQEAINESTENTVIVLGNDIVLGATASTSSTRSANNNSLTVEVGTVSTIDLNGKTIRTQWSDEAAAKHYYAIYNHGNLTIKDSGANGAIVSRGIYNYGTLTLESGKIDACDGNGGYAVYNQNGSTFVMNGGSIVTSNEDGDAPTAGYDATTLRVDEGAIATINGGVVNNVSNYTFAIDNAGTTTVNGGTITSVHSTVSTTGTMTIDGGTFTCDGLEGNTAHALVAWDGSETTINGGTFDGKDNYNGFNVDADEGAVVYINGGTFNHVHSGSLYGKGTINVKGGTFFDDPSARVVKGYVAEKDGDVFVVSKIALAENFADNSWDKIILACQNNIVPESWNVGDKKAMTINSKDYQIRIIGKNHDTYTAGGGKAPLTFQVAEIYGTAPMNATQTNTTGWSGSLMRTETMANILEVMPVKDAIKAVDKETLNGTRDGLETTSDKLFLLSEIEVNGSVYFSNNFAEGSRYAIYSDLDSQIMNASYWLRGPGKNNAIGYTQINGSGYMANGSAEYACGVVFGFCF